MIFFLDGPAEDVRLHLRRAPVMLRVVKSADGTWDALDQLDDVPKDDETVYIYRLDGAPRHMHLCGKGGCRVEARAEYRLCRFSIADEHCRTTKGWQAWCDANKEDLMREFGMTKEAGNG